MKFRVKDLSAKPTPLTIGGSEEWLNDLYASFAHTSDVASGKVTPGKLQATLELTKDLAGFVRVAGNLKYTPHIDCSRCGETITWPIDESVDVVFRPFVSEPEGGKEISLTKDDVDQYIIEGGTVDIEGLINDLVQMAIPINTVMLNESEAACKICGLAVTEDKVYGEGEPEKVSPFAVLKKLKT